MKARLFAEAAGTFAIVFPPVAGATIEPSSLSVAALVSALPVLTMVYAMGPVSGAHFNPVVTLGLAMARKFAWQRVLPYVAAQLAGAILAAALCRMLLGTAAGAHFPADPTALPRNLAFEVLATAQLMLAILAVASGRVASNMGGLVIGAGVALGVLMAGRVTGGSMNPARSLGPALFHPEALNHIWLYSTGPLLGSVFAVLAFRWLQVASEAPSPDAAPDEMGNPVHRPAYAIAGETLLR